MQATTVVKDESESAATLAGFRPAVVIPSYRTISPPRVRMLVLAICCGALLWLCHFPVAWGWLGWVALVPLMPLLYAETSRKWRYFCALIAGTAYFWPAISWMTVADYRMIGGWALLSFYCSLYFLAAVFLVRCLRRTGLPLMLTFPAVWTALEFVRCFFATGFPWYLLAHTQHDTLPVIQIADLGGAFAVSFLVAAVNVVVFAVLMRVRPVRQWCCVPATPGGPLSAGFLAQLCCGCLLLGGTLAYGNWCLSHEKFETGPRIALLQGSLDQRLRIASHTSAEAQAKVRDTYINLCKQAAMHFPRPKLIVWPETSFPIPWVTAAPGVKPSQLSKLNENEIEQSRQVVGMIGDQVTKTNVLLGLNVRAFYDTDKFRHYCSALMINDLGNAVDRYDKIHRVPFGEYVPLRDLLPFMTKFAPYDNLDYSILCGESLTRFPLGKYHFGVLICFEDTDPSMARHYNLTTVDGPPADFLINISNDGWFDGSSEHEEHLAISRFRAIETRRALARAVNMGISAVIDSDGRVVSPVKESAPWSGAHEVWSIPNGGAENDALATGQWSKYKKTEAVVVVDMPIDHRASLYAAWGDWLPYSCWALIGCGLVWSRFRRP